MLTNRGLAAIVIGAACGVLTAVGIAAPGTDDGGVQRDGGRGAVVIAVSNTGWDTGLGQAANDPWV